MKATYYNRAASCGQLHQELTTGKIRTIGRLRIIPLSASPPGSWSVISDLPLAQVSDIIRSI